ncbi:multidrug effflux MFS transporter [Egicoccus halophilus]|uniref:Bcr/CflA family drug resistance efflux transporter n=1 Tax=Egicoccus halophilus TaxID=1670830 RepID=A0A8J3A9W5_9ACTN|nr:multidrug effflux MFS transporter [Egicoccus halophilus]GGI08490.1 Bcr/CflA family drug resistance efflux transporter [Egicoccus halophilus]
MTRPALGRVEFTAVLAMSMALAALGLDLMLPAFGAMRDVLGLPADSTAIAGVVTAYMLGLAVGQLAYGPLADRFGRRPTMFVGFGVYGFGALLCTLAPGLQWLLLGRFVWGLGAAGPRVVTLAVVRDRFEGEDMARAMSMIMAVFIVVPVIAPTLGAAITAVTTWRVLFVLCLVAAVGMTLWVRRLPETLPPERRLDLNVGRITRTARLVITNRQTFGYTLALTALYGVFTSYLASSEIIFSDTFGVPEAFPLIFGGVAAVMGLAMLVNARLVGRYGTRRTAHVMLFVYVAVSTVLFVVALVTDGRPPLAVFLPLLAAILVGHALLIPNFNTIAMTPMAAHAGTAASVIGAVQLAVGASLGAVLDRLFDGTILPLAAGFLGYGVLATLVVVVVERGRLFRPLVDPVTRQSPGAAREA